MVLVFVKNKPAKTENLSINVHYLSTGALFFVLPVPIVPPGSIYNKFSVVIQWHVSVVGDTGSMLNEVSVSTTVQYVSDLP